MHSSSSSARFLLFCEKYELIKSTFGFLFPIKKLYHIHRGATIRLEKHFPDTFFMQAASFSSIMSMFSLNGFFSVMHKAHGYWSRYFSSLTHAQQILFPKNSYVFPKTIHPQSLHSGTSGRSLISPLEQVKTMPPSFAICAASNISGGSTIRPSLSTYRAMRCLSSFLRRRISPSSAWVMPMSVLSSILYLSRSSLGISTLFNASSFLVMVIFICNFSSFSSFFIRHIIILPHLNCRMQGNFVNAGKNIKLIHNSL